LFKAITPHLTASREEELFPALKDPAIDRCSGIWTTIFRATLDKTSSISDANRCANMAFRMVLPPLSGYQNICDFIACAGFGILLGYIKPDVGSKLLYGAQAALGAMPQHARTQTRTPTQPPVQIDAQPQTQPRTRRRARRAPHPSPTLAATP
jgi:hypothetical protein